MILRSVSSKNSTVYYVQKSYRKDDGKTATKYVEKLGSLSDLISRFGEKDPIGSAKAYVAELTAKEKKDREEINIKLKPATLLQANTQRNYNGGYLFLQKVYHDLGLHTICEKISKKYKNEYNLNEILSTLLYCISIWRRRLTEVEINSR